MHFFSLYAVVVSLCVFFFCFVFYQCKTEQEVRDKTGHFTAPSDTSSPSCRRWGGRRWPPQTCRQRFGPSAVAGPLWSRWSCRIPQRPANTQRVGGLGAAGSHCFSRSVTFQHSDHVFGVEKLKVIGLTAFMFLHHQDRILPTVLYQQPCSFWEGNWYQFSTSVVGITQWKKSNDWLLLQLLCFINNQLWFTLL